MVVYYLSGIFFFISSIILFMMSIILMFSFKNYFFEWNLVILNSVSMNMYMFIDWLSLMFIFCVFLISSMIIFYCCDYMYMDINKNRFFFLMIFFIFSMFLMILSPNMVSIILGWDGLGLVSYGLVIFYQNYFSFNSGMLTVLMNRIGDIMIMISISFFMIYGSWNFMLMNKSINLLLFMVMVASFTKSAQIPFSSWLPAAMAAPTPVSSLVHSSTLVTAGVYMLIRFNYLVYSSELILKLIVIVGMLTMMMAGFSANFEYDLKKIIAYSTLSQLGLMMVIYGMQMWMLSFFHLLIHAMFKSMMFMCSGVIIHSMNNFQDIRFMGNLKEFMPLTMLLMMVSNFSLCGMPFFSGFFSKDMILEMIFMNYNFYFLWIFLIISTMLTVMYSIRLLYYISSKKFFFSPFFLISDSKIMNFSMFILMFNSLMMGYLLNWMIFLMIEEIYLMFFEKILILLICMVSIFVFLGLKLFFMNNFFNFFFGNMWFLYYLNMLLNMFIFKKMNIYYYIFDKGLSNSVFEGFILNLLNFLNLKNLNMNYLISLIFMIMFLFFLVLMI
uniref:NADH dehydrogenase subunit 5 n=1 Tax=Anagyrus galinae TaxID=3085291 RepID=UPI002A838AC2|nr:NADH dehydrogenase subunit 5 [Anagyrus galinae]WON65602.1 NADH dehydrogenase subunit 5 [Anagyrus galinae]